MEAPISSILKEIRLEHAVQMFLLGLGRPTSTWVYYACIPPRMYCTVYHQGCTVLYNTEGVLDEFRLYTMKDVNICGNYGLYSQPEIL